MHIDPHTRAEGSLETYTRGGSVAYTYMPQTPFPVDTLARGRPPSQSVRSHVRPRTLAEPEQSVGTGACNNCVEQRRGKLVQGLGFRF
jgi:hypothetical protein